MSVSVGQVDSASIRLATTQTVRQVQSGLFLNVVDGKSTAVLQLLVSDDQTLLVRRNALPVLDLYLIFSLVSSDSKWIFTVFPFNFSRAY